MPIEHDAIQTGPKQPIVWATTLEGAPENVERALGVVRGHMLAAYRGEPGWLGALGLVSFDRRRSVFLSFWESESALKQRMGDVARFRERAGQLGVTIANSDRFEIHFDDRAD